MIRPQLSGIRILLVERHLVLSQAMAEYLSYLGAEVRTYHEPNEAFPVISDFRPHLILCDLTFPEEAAFKALARARQLSSEIDFKISVVGMSTLNAYAIERRAFSAGFDGVLQKPFGPTDLVHLLARLLNR